MELYLSIFEILGNDTTDLLSDNAKIDILEDKFGHVNVINTKEIKIESAEECLKIINEAMSHRKTATTFKNDTSSRSHAVFSIRVKNLKHKSVEDGEEKKEDADEKNEDSEDKKDTFDKMFNSEKPEDDNEDNDDKKDTFEKMFESDSKPEAEENEEKKDDQDEDAKPSEGTTDFTPNKFGGKYYFIFLVFVFNLFFEINSVVN